jgi:transporter family-2 protein
MKTLIALLTMAVGMLVPTQAGINFTFRDHAGHALIAGLLNFSLGLTLVLGLTLALRVPWPSASMLAGAPWWSWVGGACGATMVMVSIFAAPRLGAALMVACFVTGQLLMSVVLDHFGWVGYEVRPITAMRITGLGLLLAGVFMIQRSS